MNPEDAFSVSFKEGHATFTEDEVFIAWGSMKWRGKYVGNFTAARIKELIEDEGWAPSHVEEVVAEEMHDLGLLVHDEEYGYLSPGDMEEAKQETEWEREHVRQESDQRNFR